MHYDAAVGYLVEAGLVVVLSSVLTISNVFTVVILARSDRRTPCLQYSSRFAIASKMVIVNLPRAGRRFEFVCVPTLQSRAFEGAPQGQEHRQCEFSFQAGSESGI